MKDAYQFDTGEDALFLIEDSAITLLSRGGSKIKGDALNPDYKKALLKIVTALASSKMTISDVLVDSVPTTALEISERRIIDGPTKIDRPSVFVAEMSRRMKVVGQKDGAKGGNSTKRIRIELTDRVSADQRRLFRPCRRCSDRGCLAMGHPVQGQYRGRDFFSGGDVVAQSRPAIRQSAAAL